MLKREEQEILDCAIEYLRGLKDNSVARQTLALLSYVAEFTGMEASATGSGVFYQYGLNKCLLHLNFYRPFIDVVLALVHECQHHHNHVYMFGNKKVLTWQDRIEDEMVCYLSEWRLIHGDDVPESVLDGIKLSLKQHAYKECCAGFDGSPLVTLAQKYEFIDNCWPRRSA